MALYERMCAVVLVPGFIFVVASYCLRNTLVTFSRGQQTVTRAVQFLGITVQKRSYPLNSIQTIVLTSNSDDGNSWYDISMGLGTHNIHLFCVWTMDDAREFARTLSEFLMVPLDQKELRP